MNRLRVLRKEKKLSQKELADAMGVTRRGYQKWENEESQIKSNNAKQLADFFNVSVGYLLGYEEIEKLQQEKDFILAIENMKIDILTNSDNLNSYELSNIKKHARELYESLVWLQYEAEERE